MSTLEKLRYGLSGVVPDDARAAWGCRLIVTQDGHVDYVWDRSDIIYATEADRMELLNRLEIVMPPARLWEAIGALLKSEVMSTRVNREFDIQTLDERIQIRANTNGSCGYCYIAAWLTPQRAAAQPADLDSIPWVQGCARCEGFKAQHEPGLFTWVEAVAKHFAAEHAITLVGG